MYTDPAGQYQFRLPLGWAYDPASSHLITVQFRACETPEETVTVRAMPTFAPAEASLEAWHQALNDRCFGPAFRPFTPLQLGGRLAAAADAHEPHVHRRFLVVRGTRLDVLAEHRTPEPSAGPRLSDALKAVATTLDVPTNRVLPEFAEQNWVVHHLVTSQDAVGRQAFDEARQMAGLAYRAAQATYLYSVVANAPLPEIPAVVSVIDALVLLGRATPSLLPLRHAEHLVQRSLYTLQRLPFVPRQRRADLDRALHDRLESIVGYQSVIARRGEKGGPRPVPGRGTALLRVSPLMEEARELAAAGRNDLASRSCETAVADLLTVIQSLGREGALAGAAEQITPELLAKLRESGAASPVEQERLLCQLSLRAQWDTLQEAVTLLAQLRSLVDDVAGANEAASFARRVSARLNEAEPAGRDRHFLPPEGQAVRLARALIEHALSLEAVKDEPSLKEALDELNRAEKLLDEAGEEGVLRAHLCLVRASIYHAQRRVDGALATIERGLRAAAARPDVAAQYARELKTLKSQFLIHEGRLPEARELALEVVQSPEGDSPRERLSRANHYLNLGIIESRLREREAAAESLRQALRRSLAVSPFGEESMRALMVASTLYLGCDPEPGYHLTLAAAATLEARRVAIGSDPLRVGFDEATRRREVYEHLVHQLLEAGALPEAVAAADRGRARALTELLGGTAPEAPAAPADALPEGNRDVRRTLIEYAGHVVRLADAALNQRGAVPALRPDEIAGLASQLGAPVLLLQPVRGTLVLFVVLPSGRVEARRSLFTLAASLRYVEAVHKQFRIYSVPKGKNGAEIGDDAEFGEALGKLWRALIEPVQDLLPEGQPLVVVPYREFALVPFALLTDPAGRPLVERHAVTVTPSLATLRVLRERPPWARRAPARAYVVGDPALDPAKHLLPRLPAARAEAESLARRLTDPETGCPEVILRLGEDAHELSYRHEAQGCDLVHLSCHGSLEEPAYASVLYLAPQGPYDGLLLAGAVTDVKLNDAVVFLSACQTGQGRATADGVIGLGRAFLEAGARAVILSLWKVEASATAALCDHFYRALLNRDAPATAAEALRAAMLATRDDLQAGRIILPDGEALAPHPLNWAPFIVLGDGLAVRYQQEE
jgi:CHAT domain-containing protein/tetratricopeptide (TPR) repeat protein